MLNQNTQLMKNNLVNFKIGVSGKPKLITLDELKKMKLDSNQDYYTSIFKYNNTHKELAEKSGSVAGITDVTTDTLVWDFDSKTNLEQCRQDVLTLAATLVQNYKVDENSLQCYFSSNKGFHVVLKLDTTITPAEFKQAVTKLGGNLETFDPVVSDPARILRLPNTKNPKSGLYKIPLHIADIDTNSIEEIKELAKKPKDPEFDFKPVSLPKEIFILPKKAEKKVTLDSDFDFSATPRGWKTYKWALAQGHFEAGERHMAMMIVAATCRGLGYDRTATYHLCKSAIEKQAARTGEDKFPKEELYESIIESVFGENWDGGQFGVDHPLIQKICKRLNIDIEKEDIPCMPLDTLIYQFTDYATNFEQNIIKIGIPELDENIIYSTSTLNGVLGQPGSGKTTWIMTFLRNVSLRNIPSMFLSCDMGPPLVYAKMVQKATGCAFKDALNLYRTNKAESDKISELIKTEYKNIAFNFRSGVTVDQIKTLIETQAERTGQMPKLLAIDYLECLGGPYADPTANAGYIANQLKDLATELKLCIVLLLQTQKHSTPDISDPLLSMKQIKGASIIEQACSTVLTLWREGYNPNHIPDDKYISFAVVKNRFGSQWRGDFHWSPVRGEIRSLTEEERDELWEFKKRKKEEKDSSKEEGSGSWQ